MRYQNGIIAIVGLIMAGLMTLGTVYADQFPQASSAESVGFDALAHDLLDGLLGAADDAEPAK